MGKITTFRKTAPMWAFATLIAAPRLPAAGMIIYEHLPESLSTNVSHHTVGGPVLADDFDPRAAAPGWNGGGIVMAEWWGSAAASPSWELTFHFGTNPGFGQPQAFPAATGGFKFFVGSAGSDPDGDGIFYFSAALPGTFVIPPGPTPAGSEFWFSPANAAPRWTWALAAATAPSIGAERWDGVVSTGSTPCPNAGPHCGAWTEIQGRDFAFRLSAVPEPSTVALIGGALASLAFVRSRS